MTGPVCCLTGTLRQTESVGRRFPGVTIFEQMWLEEFLLRQQFSRGSLMPITK